MLGNLASKTYKFEFKCKPAGILQEGIIAVAFYFITVKIYDNDHFISMLLASTWMILLMIGCIDFEFDIDLMHNTQKPARLALSHLKLF